MKLGFIGLGIMGSHMARHLIAAGHDVHLRTRRKVPADLLAAGGIEEATSADVARAADIIILMLPDTDDVEHVLFGDDGLASALKPGQLVVDMSSISPTATAAFAARIKALACDYLDAPVSGGEAGAKNAALSIMVGGSSVAFARARPIFEILGKTILLIGPEPGDGQVAKCANQIVVALTINAVAEGLLFAARAGADLDAVHQALMGGVGSSKILEIHGRRMIERKMAPGFRIRLHQKDLRNALESAQHMMLALPATSLAQQLFTAAAANGAADADHSAMIQGLEALSAFSIGSDANAEG